MVFTPSLLATPDAPSFELLADELFPSQKDLSTRNIFLFLANNLGSAFSRSDLESSLGYSRDIVVRQCRRLFQMFASQDNTTGLSLERGGSVKEGYTYCLHASPSAPTVRTPVDLQSFSDVVLPERFAFLVLLSSLPFGEYSESDIAALSKGDIDVSAELLAVSDDFVRYRAFCDFFLRRRGVVSGTREKVYGVLSLDDGVLQAINHDFTGSRRRSKRLILRFLGHVPGQYFTRREIMEGAQLSDRDNVHNLLTAFVRLSSIPEYAEAYGFQLVTESDETLTHERSGTRYALQLVGERPVQVRHHQKLNMLPRSERHVPFDPSIGGKIAREIGCSIRDDIPENAESILRRASSILREEKGRLGIAFTLLEARRNGHACGVWPFKIQLDIPDNFQLGAELEKRTVRYALELGFVIFGDGNGHYSIFFLDEDERRDQLGSRYPGNEYIQYVCDVLPFQYDRFRSRIDRVLARYRKKHLSGQEDGVSSDVFPPCLPSQLHCDLLRLVGRTQRDALDPGHKRDTFLTVVEAAQFINSRLPKPLSLDHVRGRILPPMLAEIYEHHEVLGFFIGRKRTRKPTLQIVIMDTKEVESEVDSIPDTVGRAIPANRSSDFGVLLPGQI